jgi:hypothetical protein
VNNFVTTLGTLLLLDDCARDNFPRGPNFRRHVVWGKAEDDNLALVSSEHYSFWNKDGLWCELVGRGGKCILIDNPQ